nr:hypothetical protein [Tanacetum cinerariifolium]
MVLINIISDNYIDENYGLLYKSLSFDGRLQLYISREGFHLKNNVANMISNGAWSWPQSWLLNALDIGLIPIPALDVSHADSRQWRDRNGTLSFFYVAKAWNAIRPRGNQLEWSRIVWFSHNIPRYAFYFWLVMRNGLKMHDKMRQ